MTYLRLFHGRKDPNQDMDSWGEDGPCFEITYAHVTYMNSIKIKSYELEVELQRVDDLIYYDGMYYGDWSVFYEGAVHYPITKLDPEKAKLPPKGPSITLDEARDLVINLINKIDDDFRAYEDDAEPGMLLTVGDDGKSWSYQTGDNSFYGRAYRYPHWAVVSLYRGSDAAEVAADIVSQLKDLFA